MDKQSTQTQFNFFIFDPKKHGHYIDDFLETASLAHGHAVKSLEWFHWKFFKNPYGETILACAAHNNKLIGCIAFGMQPYVINGVEYSGVLQYENFVHPDYRRRGIFSTLLKMAEEEAIEREVCIMLNFPNPMSIQGFIKRKWTKLDTNKYYLKPYISTKLLRYITDIKKPFQSEKSNLQNLQKGSIENYKQNLKGKVDAKVTEDYLNYRFFSFPNGHYITVHKKGNFALARLGRRGRLKELQILHINCDHYNKANLKVIVSALKEQIKDVQLISCPCSVNGKITALLSLIGFKSVPHGGNICYKVIKKEFHAPMELLELEALNFHTY